MSLQFELFHPEDFDSGQPSDEVIVLPGELNGRLADYLGAKATLLAMTSGRTVLGYERLPYDQTFAIEPRSQLTLNPNAVHDQRAKELAIIADDIGARTLYLAGHSSAAFDVVGIGASDQIDIDHIYASDPGPLRALKWFQHPMIEYFSYQHKEGKRNPKSKDKFEDYKNLDDLMRDEPGMLEKVRRLFGVEFWTLNGLAKTPYGLNRLLDIAKDRTDTSLHVQFPEFSFTADEETLASIVMALNGARKWDSPKDVNAEILYGEDHSIGDNYQWFADTVTESIGDNAS